MEQSLCELIESAEKKLLIVSFVAHKADKIYKAIRDAIGRGVCVSFLTESSKEYGGSLEVEPAEKIELLETSIAFRNVSCQSKCD